MWLAHHHEYALLAALCNMLVVSSFYSYYPFPLIVVDVGIREMRIKSMQTFYVYPCILSLGLEREKI